MRTTNCSRAHNPHPFVLSLSKDTRPPPNRAEPRHPKIPCSREVAITQPNACPRPSTGSGRTG